MTEQCHTVTRARRRRPARAMWWTRSAGHVFTTAGDVRDEIKQVRVGEDWSVKADESGTSTS